MRNTPELTAQIVSEITLEKLYDRAQTGMAMMVGENYALQSFLRQRRHRLQVEIEEIDKLLSTASKHTDAWYETIVAERDVIQRTPQENASE